MATDETRDVVPEGVDPNSSPFELQSVEGLPLTKDERAELKRILEQYDRERAATSSTVKYID